MNITNLILKGILSDKIYIAGPIQNIVGTKDNKQFIKYKDQDGDIPATYSFVTNNIQFELAVLNGKIIGISSKFYYDNEVEFLINGKKGKVFFLNNKTKLIEFIDFLDFNKFSWVIDKTDTGGKSLGILVNSVCKIMYSFEVEMPGFYYIGSFDLNLYNKLRKSSSDVGR
ncbi:hypothetical protein [Ferruginibacter profundus]